MFFLFIVEVIEDLFFCDFDGCFFRCEKNFVKFEKLDLWLIEFFIIVWFSVCFDYELNIVLWKSYINKVNEYVNDFLLIKLNNE